MFLRTIAQLNACPFTDKKRNFYPAGEPLGHVNDLPVGVHHLIAAALTGILRRVVSSRQALWHGSTDAHQLYMQPSCNLCTQDTSSHHSNKNVPKFLQESTASQSLTVFFSTLSKHSLWIFLKF